MKNYRGGVFSLMLTVVVALFLLGGLPPITIDGYTLRKVDLLSDIRVPEPAAEEPDSTLFSPPPKPLFVDTCKTGITCIEDYSDSTQRGMKPFYEALDKGKGKRYIRIAVFGDSFIEGDIFTADLRNMLQSKYGGSGVGYIPITSLTSGFRPTVRHSFGGWSSHAVTDTAYFDRSKQGISGHYFIPHTGAFVDARGQNKYASHLDTCEVSRIYFTSKGVFPLTALVNGAEAAAFVSEESSNIRFAEVKGRIGRVRWNISQADSALFYGISMDGRYGVLLDNFSLRGSSGLSLRNIPSQTLSQFNALRPYDLIILQYGLNVATERGRDYSAYQKGMLNTIAHLRKCFPQAGILLVGVGDRNYRTDTGELRTMPGVKNLVRFQQAIAAESNVAFWNLFEAMGGEASMSKLVHAKPSMANYDYTHINFRGGKHLAELLYDALLYGKEQYDRRKQYENP